jgi:CheY-like chemotaxis protein
MDILLVDDSKLMRHHVSALLGQLLGAEVNIVEATDGREALKILQAGAKFAMIFADWNMPRITGLELTQKIREHSSTVPVIMITSETRTQAVKSALLSGVTDYIVKPVDKEILREKLERILKKPLTA